MAPVWVGWKGERSLVVYEDCEAGKGVDLARFDSGAKDAADEVVAGGVEGGSEESPTNTRNQQWVRIANLLL